jgi:hypothetical protein
MPRKGKGQKIQTATGQGYGEAKMQEEAQAVVPLAQMQMGEPVVNSMRPGEQDFRRPTERPDESIMTNADPMGFQSPPVSRERKLKALSMLPALESVASNPYSDPKLRNLVREMKSFIGPVDEL